MQFVEAFEALGYSVEVPRQDWSAGKPDGICISLWKKEMGTRGGMLWMNTKVHADPLENWGGKSGNRKRIVHLRRALTEFKGRVDIVIVSGIPGVGYQSAQPWLPEGKRSDTYWQVTDFDEETGNFEVELRKQERTESLPL